MKTEVKEKLLAIFEKSLDVAKSPLVFTNKDEEAEADFRFKEFREEVDDFFSEFEDECTAEVKDFLTFVGEDVWEVRGEWYSDNIDGSEDEINDDINDRFSEYYRSTLRYVMGDKVLTCFEELSSEVKALIGRIIVLTFTNDVT